MSTPMGMGGRGMRTFTQDSSVKKHRLSAGTMKRVFSYAKRQRSALVLFLILIAIEAALGAAIPMIFQRIIDDGIAQSNTALVRNYAILAAIIALASAGLALWERWVSANIGENLILTLRTEVFSHVQKMPLAFFSRTRTGALVQRLNGDVLGAKNALTQTLSSVVSNALTIAFTLGAMFSMSWRLTLLSLVLVPFFIAPARPIGQRLARFSHQQYEANADASQFMNERFNVGGAQLVKIYGTPDREDAEFADTAGKIRAIGLKSVLLSTYFRVGLTLLAALAVAAVYGLGGAAAIRGELSVGVVVALATYLTRLYGPIVAMSNVQVDIMTTLVAFERVFEVLDLKPMISDHPETKPLPDGGAVSLEFRNVSFRYPTADQVSLASLESVATLPRDAGRDVLHDISFSVPAGKTVALVGTSGGGKSTLSSLAMRMYDPTAGEVLIDGHRVTDLTMQSVYDAIAVVSQDVQLFHDTIANNLRYAAPEATSEQLITALQQAHIWQVVEKLPQGIDTIIGDRGYRLSGGERQRLAIARALLKKPRLLILDEATAHLDSESETLVQKAVAKSTSGTTAVVIAHRLATIRDADLILVLQEGRVVQRGTHEELIAVPGHYADLSANQFGVGAS